MRKNIQHHTGCITVTKSVDSKENSRPADKENYNWENNFRVLQN